MPRRTEFVPYQPKTILNKGQRAPTTGSGRATAPTRTPAASTAASSATAASGSTALTTTRSTFRTSSRSRERCRAAAPGAEPCAPSTWSSPATTSPPSASSCCHAGCSKCASTWASRSSSSAARRWCCAISTCCRRSTSGPGRSSRSASISTPDSPELRARVPDGTARPARRTSALPPWSRSPRRHPDGRVLHAHPARRVRRRCESGGVVRRTADHGGPFVLAGGLTLADQQRDFFFDVLRERFPDRSWSTNTSIPKAAMARPDCPGRRWAGASGRVSRGGHPRPDAAPDHPGDKRTLNKRIVEALANQIY